MAEFEQAWAVMRRDLGWDDEDDVQKDVVDVLRVYWDQADAHAEVMRLRADSSTDDLLYDFEETEVERRRVTPVSPGVIDRGEVDVEVWWNDGDPSDRSAVRVTHKETGLQAESRQCDSQIENYNAAVAELERQLADLLPQTPPQDKS